MLVMTDDVKKGLVLVLSTFFIAVLCYFLGFNISQIESITIFALMIFTMLLFWKFRLSIAFVAVSFLVILGLLDIQRFIEFANFDVIFFLIGMMSIIGFLEENHFFEYLIDIILRYVRNSGERLALILMIASAILAALLDEVTSTLFMTATILQLTSLYGINPIPFIMMSVFATNIGSSATVIGNPVGVMIAMKGSITFADFLRWSTPISIVALIWTMFISKSIFSKDIRLLDERIKGTKLSLVDGHSFSMHRIRLCWVIFISTILSLMSHSFIESLLKLEKNSMLICTALMFGGFSLLLQKDRAVEIIEKRIDWWTLVFFALLFASVGTLQYVGVTKIIADFLYTLSSGSQVRMFFVFTWITAILSGFMDNVLAVATFIPVIHELEKLTNVFPLWWGVLFAATYFGNLTIMGSTANIIAVGMLERRSKANVTFIQWLRIGSIVAIQTLAIAIILILIQFPLMPL